MNVIVEKVSYGLTVKNGDDYEKCHLEGVVIGGEVHGAINDLKDVVGRTLRIEIPSNEFVNTKTDHHNGTDSEGPAEVEEPAKPAKKKKKSVDVAVEAVEEKKETITARLSRKQKIMNELNTLGVEFNPRHNADKLQAVLDAQSSEVEEPKKVSVAEKVKKSKYQTYDRTIDEHMDKLCDLLDEDWPTWEDHEDLVKKQISMKLVKVEFLDEKGKVLESFMDALNERIEFCIQKIADS